MHTRKPIYTYNQYMYTVHVGLLQLPLSWQHRSIAGNIYTQENLP